MANYTSVDREKLQMAFAMAHHAGEDDSVPKDCRDKFRAIARLIWVAHGERGAHPPAGSGKSLMEKIEAAKRLK